MCLGFDLRAEGLRDVCYDSTKLELPDDDAEIISMPAELQERLLKTKFSHWAYEHEVRRIVSLRAATREGGLYFYPFGDDLQLREVILGHLCPGTLLEPVRGLLKSLGLGAVASRARLGYKFFEVKEHEQYRAK